MPRPGWLGTCNARGQPTSSLAHNTPNSHKEALSGFLFRSRYLECTNNVKETPKANQSTSGKHYNGHQRCNTITRRRILWTRASVNFSRHVGVLSCSPSLHCPYSQMIFPVTMTSGTERFCHVHNLDRQGVPQLVGPGARCTRGCGWACVHLIESKQGSLTRRVSTL